MSENTLGYTKLHVAAWNGDRDAVDTLLASSGDVNDLLAKSSNGFDAPGLAVMGGHPDLAIYMLQRLGIDANIRLQTLLPEERQFLESTTAGTPVLPGSAPAAMTCPVLKLAALAMACMSMLFTLPLKAEYA